jgi:hypothetical protein
MECTTEVGMCTMAPRAVSDICLRQTIGRPPPQSITLRLASHGPRKCVSVQQVGSFVAIAAIAFLRVPDH